MKTHVHALILTAAAALTLAVVTVPATQAFAKGKSTTPQPNLCYTSDGRGNSDFYLPGEIVRNGPDTLVCGTDGQWHRVAELGASPAPNSPSGTTVSPPNALAPGS